MGVKQTSPVRVSLNIRDYELMVEFHAPIYVGGGGGGGGGGLGTFLRKERFHIFGPQGLAMRSRFLDTNGRGHSIAPSLSNHQTCEQSPEP
jgi:hypothetical protein